MIGNRERPTGTQRNGVLCEGAGTSRGRQLQRQRQFQGFRGVATGAAQQGRLSFDQLHHRVIQGPGDRAVVDQKGIGDAGEPFERLGGIGAERFAAAVAAGAHQGPPEAAGQQPVQRRSGQQHPELGTAWCDSGEGIGPAIPWREARRVGSAPVGQAPLGTRPMALGAACIATTRLGGIPLNRRPGRGSLSPGPAGQQHDRRGRRAKQRQGLRCQMHVGRDPGRIAYQQRQGLGRPPFAPPQPRHRRPVGGIHQQLKAAHPLQRQNLPALQQRRGRVDQGSVVGRSGQTRRMGC